MKTMYELPEFNVKKIEAPKKSFKGWFLIVVFLLGVLGGSSASYVFYLKLKEEIVKAGVPIVHSEKIIEKEYIPEYIPQTTQEEKIINIVKESSPSVVSIVAYKDVLVYEQTYGQDLFFIVPKLESKGTERQQVGAGTGFIVSEDGLILTNKHVVNDVDAEYVVVMNDNKEYNAKVLARDPVHDLAIMKIEGSDDSFKPLKFGNIEDVQVGQTVIAIGNALGRFQNTVSVGVVSGLGRTVVATGENFTNETLEDIIQTDTAINRGNSGGPLINLKGEVVGINTAVSTEGQNISFAISIDKAKRGLEQVKTIGKISYPYMGVRYIILNETIGKNREVDVDYGALVVGDGSNPAVVKDSPADKGGIKEGDIILEMNGEKVTENNSLAKIISKYNPFEEVNLKILRDGQEIYLNIILGEWEQ